MLSLVSHAITLLDTLQLVIRLVFSQSFSALPLVLLLSGGIKPSCIRYSTLTPISTRLVETGLLQEAPRRLHLSGSTGDLRCAGALGGQPAPTAASRDTSNQPTQKKKGRDNPQTSSGSQVSCVLRFEVNDNYETGGNGNSATTSARLPQPPRTPTRERPRDPDHPKSCIHQPCSTSCSAHPLGRDTTDKRSVIRDSCIHQPEKKYTVGWAPPKADPLLATQRHGAPGTRSGGTRRSTRAHSPRPAAAAPTTTTRTTGGPPPPSSPSSAAPQPRPRRCPPSSPSSRAPSAPRTSATPPRRRRCWGGTAPCRGRATALLPPAAAVVGGGCWCRGRPACCLLIRRGGGACMWGMARWPLPLPRSRRRRGTGMMRVRIVMRTERTGGRGVCGLVLAGEGGGGGGGGYAG